MNTQLKESAPEGLARGRKMLERAFALCARKGAANTVRLAAAPKSAALAVDGDYFAFKEGFFEIGNWTSSFFTGMALLAYRASENEHFLKPLTQLAPLYRGKVTEHAMETMHDLGFLYSLYSVGLYKLTGDKEHRDVGLLAAEVLARRFQPNGNYIRAWGRIDELNTDYAGLAIIDCMMNLPLLFWSSQETGNPKHREIAIRHADTTLKNFIRADDSVYHSYRFDLASGQPVRGDNYCGRAVESHWARGTAWAIYGFALAYRYTREARYLNASLKLARKFLACLGSAAIPVWDFKLPAGEFPLLDSSAAAVAVCGLQEILRHKPEEKELAAAAQKMLAALCSDAYLDANDACCGVLRLAEVGEGIGKAKNAYTSWGDYFLMEAVANELQMGDLFW